MCTTLLMIVLLRITAKILLIISHRHNLLRKLPHSKYSIHYMYCVTDCRHISKRRVYDTEDDDDISEEEVEDDGRIYKNPRNSPSAQCPRDEEHANFLVSYSQLYK